MTLIVSDRGLVELMKLKRYLREQINKCNAKLSKNINKLDGLVTVDSKSIALVERIKVYNEILKKLDLDLDIDSTKRSTMYEEVS